MKNMLKRFAPVIAAMGFILVLVMIMIGSHLIKKYTPTDERADLQEYYALTSEEDMAIVMNGVILEDKARWVDGHIYLEYSLVHEINERFYWDYNENLLLYTTATDVVTAEPLSADYYIGTKKTTSDYGELIKLDGELVYVNLEYVDLYSDIVVNHYENPNRVVIETTDRTYNQVLVKKDTQIRYRGGIKSLILTDVAKGDYLEVLTEGEDWDQVLTSDGYIGYVRRNALGKRSETKVPLEFTVEEFSHQFVEGPICLAWHQVTNQSANSQVADVIASTKGLSVISPTWFYLNDSEGGIASLASSDYVDYCHSQGIEVWGLVSNLEDSSVDSTAVLTHTSYRENLVNKLISKAIEYKLDGINLDVEALDQNNVGDGFIQLVRELSLKCHANGLTLSVDNYVPTDYTAFYNRSQQALFADYIIIMAYDEHYVGSDAGSVSSIGFVRDGVANTLKEVPANQIILGLPFYTRLWAETPQYNEDGDLVSIETTSSAIGMDTAENTVNSYGADIIWDELTGQNYAQYEKDGKTYKIWFEDEESLELKLQEVKGNNLAGVAFWKLGFERSKAWNTIVKYLNE